MRKEPEYTCPTLVITLLFCLCLRAGAIQTHKIEDYCGHSVSRYDPVGILRFNTSTFSARQASYRRECKVKVSPEQVPGSGGHGRVQFYFTDFDLPGSCSDLSVLLLDGSSTYDSRVVGAPEPICGYNATLTSHGLVFNTTTSLFTVLLRWTQPASTLGLGGFIIKFVAFYDGPCENSDEVITCNNTRCTSKAYHCHDDIDTCGPDEEDICSVKEDIDELLEKVLDWLEEVAKDIAVIVALCIGLCVLGKIFKHMRKKQGPLFKCFSKCCRDRRPTFRLPDEHPFSPQDSINSLTPRRDFDTVSMELTPSSEVARASPARFGYVTSLNSATLMTNADLDARDPDPQAQSGLVSLPPSYDSLGPHQITSPPSYEDYVSNEHRYNETSI